MMRVLHVVRQYAPGVGGLETFVRDLIATMAPLGFEGEVLTLDRLFTEPRKRLPSDERIEDVWVRRVPFVGHRRFFTPMIPADALAGYDVVHVHGVDGMFDRIAVAPKPPRQLRIATSHGLFFHTPFMRTAKRIYFHTITRVAAGFYDGLIANSGGDLERLSRLGPPSILIPNGVNALLADAQGSDLFTIGRLASHKRLDRLIEALAHPALSATSLHVVGPEWDVTRETLAAQARRLGVLDRLRLHGRLEADALARVVSRCGLFLSASEYEGFGMALIEAMSAGLAPVVHPNASYHELLRARWRDALVDFTDACSAAIATRNALDALDSATRLRAKRFAERFSWRAHAEATARWYDDVRALRRNSGFSRRG